MVKSLMHQMVFCILVWATSSPQALAHTASETKFDTTSELLQQTYEAIGKNHPRDHIQIGIPEAETVAARVICSQLFQAFAEEMRSLGESLLLPFRKPRPPILVQETISYRGVAYPHLVGIKDSGPSGSGSFRYLPALSPRDAEIDLLMWHGFGAKGSHAQGFLQPMRTLTDEKDKTQKSVRRMLSEIGRQFIAIAPEALDLPESGNGPTVLTEEDISAEILSSLALPFRTLDSTMERLGGYVQKRKSISRKMVGLGKSASVGLLAELNSRRPELFDALVFIGPLHPEPEIGFRYSVDAYYESTRQKLFEPNLRAFNWVNRMYEGMRWHRENPPFGGKPTLVLIGEKDIEVSPAAREWFRGLAAKHPNVVFVEVAGAPHDPLMPNGRLKYNPDYVHFVLQNFFFENVLR
jgi:hypothetical protein